MIKISGIVITKNEEEMIADCLDSLSFCDEIIVVDSGSEDRTKDIAKKMGAKIVEYSSDDFSEMRNMGMERAIGEWLLYIDADERATPELISNITCSVNKDQISKTESNIVAFRVQRKNYYLGNHEWPYIERLERLFEKKSLEKWYGKLHESPKVKGNIETLDGYLLHYTHRNLASMVSKTMEWSKIEAEMRFKTGHPKMSWWRFPRVMITAFLDRSEE